MGRISLALAVLACALSSAAEARGWQCVTYARSITDFSIRGNAHTWWHQAEGRYERGSKPEAGAVMAFKRNAGSRLGHVAVVKEVVNDRELIIDHANWTVRGGVERNARAIDVSEAGDWSAVRVSYGSGMGTRVNPIYGFIYASDAPRVEAPKVQFAEAARGSFTLGDEVRALAAAEGAL
jgi:surface antigen